MRKFAAHGTLSLVVIVSFLGCNSSKSSFDAEHAPFGERAPTTVSHSVLQLGSKSSSALTQVVGSKTIGGESYSRLAVTNVNDPSSGVEWWINSSSY